jgi:hypothetical protein
MKGVFSTTTSSTPSHFTHVYFTKKQYKKATVQRDGIACYRDESLDLEVGTSVESTPGLVYPLPVAQSFRMKDVTTKVGENHQHHIMV